MKMRTQYLLRVAFVALVSALSASAFAAPLTLFPEPGEADSALR
jgi:hypothetical protein